MAQEKAPQLSFTRIVGSTEVTCTVCGQINPTPLEGNRHFAAQHSEKLCPATKRRIVKTNEVSADRARRHAATSVKVKAGS